MKVLWISTAAGRHDRKETKRRADAERRHAEAVRRANTRSAHVAAAVASIPSARRPETAGIPAQRSPID